MWEGCVLGKECAASPIFSEFSVFQVEAVHNAMESIDKMQQFDNFTYIIVIQITMHYNRCDRPSAIKAIGYV